MPTLPPLPSVLSHNHVYLSVCGALTDTVGAYQSQHLTRSGHGQSMQFEGVGPVAVGGVTFEVLGEVDDLDGLKRTFLLAKHNPVEVHHSNIVR